MDGVTRKLPQIQELLYLKRPDVMKTPVSMFTSLIFQSACSRPVLAASHYLMPNLEEKLVRRSFLIGLVVECVSLQKVSSCTSIAKVEGHLASPISSGRSWHRLSRTSCS
jgi:hypothetical protein